MISGAEGHQGFASLEGWLRRRYAHLLQLYRVTLGVPAGTAALTAIESEVDRQARHLNLIASESIASEAVLVALATIVHNQTIEGPVGGRWFPETDGLDAIEAEAEALASQLFGLSDANVQPHSTTQANQAVFLGCLDPGDRILTLSLTSGGHVSHGSAASLAKRLYDTHYYSVCTLDGRIDLGHLEERIADVGPKLIISGTTAYPRQVDFHQISMMSAEAGALHLVDLAHVAGLVCAGLHPGADSADFITLGLHKTMCGPRGGIVLTNERVADNQKPAVFPGAQGAPMPNLLVAKLLTLAAAQQDDFIGLQRRIKSNAAALAASLRENGVSILTGGTDTHLVMIRVAKDDTGTEAEQRLLAAGILSNRNYVPGDSIPGPMGGLRLGTIALSQLGFMPEDMHRLGPIIANALRRIDGNRDYRTQIARLLDEVLDPARTTSQIAAS